MTTVELVAKVAETAAESQVPTKVEDPSTLARVAQLVLGGEGGDDLDAWFDRTRDEAAMSRG